MPPKPDIASTQSPSSRVNVPALVLSILLVVTLCLLVFGFVAASIQTSKVQRLASHILYAIDPSGVRRFKDYEGMELGSLPTKTTTLPSSITKDILEYTHDCFSRFYAFISARKDSIEHRKDTAPKKLLYVETSEIPAVSIWHNPAADVCVVLFRGTANKNEWEIDLMFNPSTFKHQCEDSHQACFSDICCDDKEGNFAVKIENSDKPSNAIKFHSGFLKYYNFIRRQLHDAIKEIGAGRLLVAGHSLGAGVCSVVLYDMIEKAKMFTKDNIMVLTYAAPRAANPKFADWVEAEKLEKFWNLQNRADVIVQSPLACTPALAGKKRIFYYKHAGQQLMFEYIGLNLLDTHSMATYQEKCVDPSNLVKFK